MSGWAGTWGAGDQPYCGAGGPGGLSWGPGLWGPDRASQDH